MLPWQERSLLCQMFATCSYPEKVLVQDSGPYFLHSRATANFLFKNIHLVTIGTGGRSGENFNGSVKLCDLYNPLFGASFTFLSLILGYFVLKFPNFRRHGNKGRSGVNFCDTDKLYDILNPLIRATYFGTMSWFS